MNTCEFIEYEITAIDFINQFEKNDSEWEIETPDGWQPVSKVWHKGKKQIYELATTTFTCRVSTKHLFQREDLSWDYVENFKPKDLILTKNGAEKVLRVVALNIEEEVFDVTVEHENHRYFTDGIVSHNSGGGKSIAMLNVGFNLLGRGLNGVYITLEMRDRVVAKRLDSMISRISGKNIYANKLKVGQDIELAKEQGYGRFFVKRMREGTTNADHIISYLRELEAVHGFKPDFVIVDYIDLCASVQKHGGDNMFTKDKYVTEEIRAIGFDFDCLMISASQLGRGSLVATKESKSIGQEHIQGGISKINTSDLVIALVKDEAMDAAGEYRFEFLKARNSNAVNKKITMRWDHESLRISDLGLKMIQPTRIKSLAPADVQPGKSLGLEDLLKRS